VDAQPIFAELFAYDPAATSQLLGKWRISSQLDSLRQGLPPVSAKICPDNGARITLGVHAGTSRGVEPQIRAEALLGVQRIALRRESVTCMMKLIPKRLELLSEGLPGNYSHSESAYTVSISAGGRMPTFSRHKACVISD
jgi:hypothetical protein